MNTVDDNIAQGRWKVADIAKTCLRETDGVVCKRCTRSLGPHFFYC
jgi:hypothetical protein